MRRYQISNVARVVARDLELSGVAMNAGDMVLLATCLGGMDDRQYDQPLTVDFVRSDRKSVVFGKGPHQCVGAWLARAELRHQHGETIVAESRDDMVVRAEQGGGSPREFDQHLVQLVRLLLLGPVAAVLDEMGLAQVGHPR